MSLAEVELNDVNVTAVSKVNALTLDPVPSQDHVIWKNVQLKQSGPNGKNYLLVHNLAEADSKLLDDHVSMEPSELPKTVQSANI